MSYGNRLVDSYGRRLRTLRVSVTDRCNFRCIYCMPPDGMPFVDRSTYLTRSEIARFVRILGRFGRWRVRLTGGEPLLRRDVVDIVRALRSIDTIEELSMTTNASRLDALALPLREAGLDRVNVSLDSIDPARFEAITLSRMFERVRDGIEAAIASGLGLKINVVVLNGISDEEILAFARMAVERDITVRFLEFMPLCGTGWRPDLVYPIARVRELVSQHYRLHPLPRGDRPAETFAIEGGGRIGFIASLSEPFCGNCSRMRLTADGNIRPCLFSNYELPVGALLKNGATDDDIIAAIRTAVANKPRGSEFDAQPYRAGERVARTTIASPLIHSLGG